MVLTFCGLGSWIKKAASQANHRHTLFQHASFYCAVRCCVFDKSEVCGNLVSIKCIGTNFPILLAMTYFLIKAYTFLLLFIFTFNIFLIKNIK